jgi:hypothetical protein
MTRSPFVRRLPLLAIVVAGLLALAAPRHAWAQG